MKDGNSSRKSKLFSSRIDLSEDTRVGVGEILNSALATLVDLYSQTKFAHWNVKGSDFWGLHKLFDQLAEDLEEHIDETAERITALGGVAHGTAKQVANASVLEDFPLGVHSGLSVVKVLADRFASSGKLIRSGISQTGDFGDPDTADLLTAVSRYLDQSLYFLESHLHADDNS